MISHFYDIQSENSAWELLAVFEQKCILAKGSIIELFNGAKSDIPKHIIENLYEMADTNKLNIWLTAFEEKHGSLKEKDVLLNESELVNLCNEIVSFYTIIENDVIYGHNLKGFTLSKECKLQGEKAIDIFCANYPFELSFDDYISNFIE